MAATALLNLRWDGGGCGIVLRKRECLQLVSPAYEGTGRALATVAASGDAARLRVPAPVVTEPTATMGMTDSTARASAASAGYPDSSVAPYDPSAALP